MLRFRPSIWSEALECYLAELYVAPAVESRGGLGVKTIAVSVIRAMGMVGF